MPKQLTKAHAAAKFVVALALISLASACGTVPPTKLAETKSPLAVPASKSLKQIRFWRMLTKIPMGTEIAKMRFGWFCAPGNIISWRGGKLNITDEEYSETFKTILKEANYPVVGDPYALFGDPSEAKADLVIAGLIDKVDMNACFPFSGSPSLDIGNTGKLKGAAYMHISWQVYSRQEGKVVYEFATEGSFGTEEVMVGSTQLFLRNAFAANVKNMLADQGFLDQITGP